MESPYEDVPPHIVGPMAAWFETFARQDPAALYWVCSQLRLPDWSDPTSNPSAADECYWYLVDRARKNPTLLIAYAEQMLRINGNQNGQGQRLDRILKVGNSLYRVRDDSRGLEVRVVDGVKEQVQQAIVESAETSAGAHLTAAWNEAYGKSTDPGQAYSEAIKAVEAVAAPVISPKNASATLGTIIADIKKAPAKWTFAIPDGKTPSMDRVLGMLELLWQGQTGRHGGNAPTPTVTIEQARAAVNLASTLVQWFASGAIQ